VSSVEVRTLAILRGVTPDEAVRLAERSWDVGIDLVEVPVQDDSAWAALEAVVARAAARLVGAGTVVDEQRARRAIDVGARVLVTPGLDERVVAVARSAGTPILPGVMTPTEVQRFPASVLGVDHLRSLRPVFPEMRFVVTGGVDRSNAEVFVEAGAAGLAFGGSIEAVLEDPGAAMTAAAAIDHPWLLEPLREGR
jgi:2-dehydro-3-deoxyphosphogluconate aldolase / (4S)-4-hydroxy-2-oxoglutarate aldolase